MIAYQLQMPFPMAVASNTLPADCFARAPPFRRIQPRTPACAGLDTETMSNLKHVVRDCSNGGNPPSTCIAPTPCQSSRIRRSRCLHEMALVPVLYPRIRQNSFFTCRTVKGDTQILIEPLASVFSSFETATKKTSEVRVGDGADRAFV